MKKHLKQIKGRGVRIWTDKLSYFHILVIWIVIIIIFGCIYYFSQNNESFLLYSKEGGVVVDIKDAVYFSFVTATTTGFGDIVPYGSLKLIAMVEVIFGLMLIALVTSKLVSIKQDKILTEVYELSFNEKISRLRSSSSVFRQNLDRIMSKIEDGSIRKREINSVHIYLSSLEDVINETLVSMTRSDGDQFVKNIDPVNTELIFNSILSSFEKFHELTTVMNQNKLEWKTEANADSINKCMTVNEDLFGKLNVSKGLAKQTIDNLNSRKSDVIKKIKVELDKKHEPSDVQEQTKNDQSSPNNLGKYLKKSTSYP